jgi:hypothetical protein
MTNIKKLAVTIALLAACSSAYAEQGFSLSFVLPQQEEWVQITDKPGEGQYLKEWIPQGSEIESTEWLIAEQRIILGKRTTAQKYIKSIFQLAKKSCTSASYNGSEEGEIDGIASYYGRIMCAQKIGTEYGTFTDIRVVVNGVNALVINSELRIPPSSVARTLSFDDPEKISLFMQTAQVSWKFIREEIGLVELQ